MASTKHGDALEAIGRASDQWVEEPGKPQTVIERYRTYDPEHAAEAEKRLVRKIDLRILPFVLVIYICNYLDRNSITQARLYGMQKDTGTNGTLWNTAISIFSAGYIAMQLPSPMIMSKLPPSLFLPCCMILWAIVSGCTAATNSPASLFAVRFFLGIVEAPFFPGAIYFLSCWYTKREIGIRMALLVSGIVLSNAFAGLLSAAILSGMDGRTSLASWRWLFIIEGLMTIAVALVAMAFLPNYPATTKWLTEEEKTIAQARLLKDMGAEDATEEEDTSLMRGLSAAVKDYRVWIFACMQMATTASISYSHFFPTLIKELGFSDNLLVLLLTSPPYLLAFFWSIGFSWHADRSQKRSPHASISMSTAIMATIVLIAVPYKYQWVRYAFTFPLTAGIFGVYSTTYAWLSSTIVMPRTKRAAAIGLANLCANVASLYGNYFWLDEYEPTFQVSWGILLAFQVLGLGCILSLRFLLKRSNRQFEELSSRVSEINAAQLAELDPVEQNAVVGGFRYIT
ncbi:hypothetical protein JX266_010707 [Neoarthrinium moseri]|nr:hypothetical protein JX266_010707 [Neoarthrinium moseri]